MPVDLQLMTKADLAQQFLAVFEQSSLDDEQRKDIMRWIWSTVIEPSKDQLKAAKAAHAKQQQAIKALLWNVHEIRRNGSTLFAFHGDQFCTGATVDELLAAFQHQAQ